MQIIRFFEPGFSNQSEVLLQEENLHIAFSVLRLQVGDLVQIINGQGVVGSGEVGEISKKKVLIRIQNRKVSEVLRPTLTLFQALPKGDRLELILQKGVEWGIQNIVFLQTDHAVSQPKKDKGERWNKIAIEALRQSGNAFLPKIVGPVTVEEACKQFPADASILFDELEKKTHFSAWVQEQNLKSCRFAIGPEGGWSQNERDLFHKNKFQSVSIGSHMLRVETASISAMALLRVMLPN